MMTNEHLIRRPALYPGTCWVCKTPFEPGTEILWDRLRKRGTHAEAGVCEDEMEVGEIRQAESEHDGEHRMNCSDAECLGRDALDDRADSLLVEYEQTKGYVAGSKTTDPYGNLREHPIGPSDADRADMLLDEWDAGARLRRAAALPKGIYRVSFDADETDTINVQITPRPGGKNLDFKEWRGEYVGKFLTHDLPLQHTVLKAGTIDYARGVQYNDPKIRRLVRALNVLLNTADSLQYAESFAVAACACMRCGHPLVDEESRARLMGPECAKRMDR